MRGFLKLWDSQEIPESWQAWVWPARLYYPQLWLETLYQFFWNIRTKFSFHLLKSRPCMMCVAWHACFSIIPLWKPNLDYWKKLSHYTNSPPTAKQQGKRCLYQTKLCFTAQKVTQLKTIWKNQAQDLHKVLGPTFIPTLMWSENIAFDFLTPPIFRQQKEKANIYSLVLYRFTH